MKTKVILTLCVVFVLAIASNASAQVTLIAGSPEDKAFTAAMAAQGDAKQNLLLDFEKQFPNSKALPDVYNELMNLYNQKNDKAKASEVGEKAIKVDPDNFTALMAVSRNYGLEKKNLDKAVQYAQHAVDVLAKKKTEPRYTEDQAWKSYVDSTDAAARANLAWARTIKP
jgi:tetratricopeptide (TPR) repeat protein